MSRYRSHPYCPDLPMPPNSSTFLLSDFFSELFLQIFSELFSPIPIFGSFPESAVHALLSLLLILGKKVPPAVPGNRIPHPAK